MVPHHPAVGRVLLFCLTTCTSHMMWGEEAVGEIYVFGDNFTDTGNGRIWDDGYNDPGPPIYFPEGNYLGGRASNGELWIEGVARALQGEAHPWLEEGTNFAFTGAESGSGVSDQGTPNFLTQVRIFQTSKGMAGTTSVASGDLFVVWVGMNDFLRIFDTEKRPYLTKEDICQSIENIRLGIQQLSESGARTFLVANMPPLHVFPYFRNRGEAYQAAMLRLGDLFNADLEEALASLEAELEVRIIRFNVREVIEAMYQKPNHFGLRNVEEAALGRKTGEDASSYLFWDGFHLTVAGQAVLARFAEELISTGSWWGQSVARGPDGTALLGLGPVYDRNWPWIYVYGLGRGQWVRVLEEAGSVEGFPGYCTTRSGWLWMKADSPYFYDYTARKWETVAGSY